MAAFDLFGLGAILAFGFLLGIRHAFDADHIAAVATIATGGSGFRKQSLIGASWGLGHTIALMAVGMGIIFLGLSIPAGVAAFFEFLVGIVLIALGLPAVTAFLRSRSHSHLHSHGKARHAHMHSHEGTQAHTHHHKSILVGMLHGLAGSAALMLLVLATIRPPFEAFIYIMVFGAGSVIGMFFVTTALGAAISAASSRAENMVVRIRFLAGSVSILVGFILIFELLLQ
ncbi:MAG: urease accessory protein UreH [Candidatus Aenigmarchaeota archaeon]|nr:urease accessory protein UreH [Candidatus Aenigmarchaeota archaeon]